MNWSQLVVNLNILSLTYVFLALWSLKLQAAGSNPFDDKYFSH